VPSACAKTRTARIQLGLSLLVLFLAMGIPNAVTAQQNSSASALEHADKQPQNWLTYYGNYRGWSYSALDQVSAKNVKQLAPVWAFAAGGPPPDSSLQPGLESAPLVVDGILYLAGIQNNIYALDVYPWPSHFTQQGPRGVRGLPSGTGFCTWALRIIIWLP